MQVELRPHKGIQRTPLGDVEVTHPQYLVIVTNEDKSLHVGYVGTQEKAPFNGLLTFTRLPQVMQDAIVKQVDEQLGGQRKVFSVPDVKFPEEEERDLDDEEDEDDSE